MIPLLLASAIPPELQKPVVAEPIAPLVAQAINTNSTDESGDSTPPRTFPYASLQLGVGFPQDLDGTFTEIPVNTTLDLNTGFQGELAVGYKINDFRTDLSVGYGNYGVNSQSFNGGNAGNPSGSVDLWTIMLNAYYDIPIRNSAGELSRWSPYIGAGVGYGNLSVPSCINGCYGSGSSGTFAWQAKAGVSYRATEQGFLFAEGGYLGTAGSNNIGPVTFDDFGAWRVSIGWRQGFGGAPKSKPVARVPEQPTVTPDPAPAPTPAPQPEPAMPIRGLW